MASARNHRRVQRRNGYVHSFDFKQSALIPDRELVLISIRNLASWMGFRLVSWWLAKITFDRVEIW